jgi:hypothetical protein
MSTVYASVCYGKAGLMTKNMQDIPQDGIWAKKELVELMKVKENPAEQVNLVSHPIINEKVSQTNRLLCVD